MHFSVFFILIHHSFGFFDIFLEGGLETPKTPWIRPCDHVRFSQTFKYLNKQKSLVRHGIIHIYKILKLPMR